MSHNILILGSTGMLGNAVARYFLNSNNYSVTTTYREKFVAFDGNAVYFDVLTSSLESFPADFDYVINCIGVIKPFMAENPMAAIKINSLFPWQIAEWCEQNGAKLFHITTDCVYSGKKGKYTEDDEHDALDAYGKSKSLGECTKQAMVLRTSIIGEEIHKDASLIAWAKSQKGKTVGGYATHLWNGITTNMYARVCDDIIKNNLYERGLFHIFAGNDVSKLDMLRCFDVKYNLGLTIEEQSPEPIDRTLRTSKNLCAKLSIPTVERMIEEL